MNFICYKYILLKYYNSTPEVMAIKVARKVVKLNGYNKSLILTESKIKSIYKSNKLDDILF